MKIYYGLDTVVLKLIETKKNNSSSLDIHQLVGKATYKWMVTICQLVLREGNGNPQDGVSNWDFEEDCKDVGVLLVDKANKGIPTQLNEIHKSKQE